MVVIKEKEKVLKKKPLSPISKQNMSEKVKRKLSRPQDNQPIPTVAV